MSETDTASSMCVELSGESIVASESLPEDSLAKLGVKPRVIVQAPKPLDRVFANRKKVKHHYATAGVKINESNERKILTEKSPFKYPKDIEEFSYRVLSKAWRDIMKEKQLQLKCSEIHSYRTKQGRDLLNRLYVKDPEIKSMKTILDLDPQFFSIIEGRPSLEKFDRRAYVTNVREVLRTKIVTGYREDEIMLIDENFEAEHKLLEKIRQEFQKYVDTFERFLFNDHSLAMKCLRQADEVFTRSNERYEHFKFLSKDYGALKSVVYKLEEKWRNCKMYQRFLYLMSPIEWRIENDFNVPLKRVNLKEDIETLLESDAQEGSVFDRYKLSSANVLSLENLIDQFLDDVKIQGNPLLYFETPDQLLKVFTFIEIQNLNSLLHSEELAIPLEEVSEGIAKIELEFSTKISALQETIDSLRKGIEWEEQRAKYLEDIALELIYGSFKKLISDNEAIDLFVFVEDAYEARIGTNDSNLTMQEMLMYMEIAYRDSLLQLDRLPTALVNKAEAECYKEEAKIMQVANDAAKKVLQIEQLMKHLIRLLEPPVFRTTRELKWRSIPFDKPKRPPTPPKPLTISELDFLTFFSEFCHHQDDPDVFRNRILKSQK